MRTPKILLGVPCAPTVDTNAMNGIIAACIRTLAHNGQVANFAYRRTDVARNTFVDQLLKGDCDWLLMLDSDHLHPFNIVDRFVGCIKARPEIKVLSGLNYRRASPFEPMAYTFEAEHRLASISPGIGKGFITVDAVATCALMVHRRVFEAMTFPWFFYRYGDETEAFSGSEDISFFRKLKEQTDYKVWVHTELVSPHMTLETVGDESRYRRYLEEQKDAIETD